MKRIYKGFLAGTMICCLGISSLPILAEGEDTPPSQPDGNGGGTPPDGQGGTAPSGQGGGADTATYDYSGTLSGTVTADGSEQSSSKEDITASTADQNGLLTENGGTLTVDSDTVSKSGDDENGDNCNFYGINSISLTVGSSSLTKISNSKLTASSTGSNGIFATDSGTVYANSDIISTTADNSRGLDATYGGKIIANDMNIQTEGDHCAAIATDRGGGSISATNSTLNTNGSGSPILYSTGDIEVDNVTGTASGSQIAGMEGLNTILIYNSNLSSKVTSATASDPVANGVIIYQSTSGDAETTTGSSAQFQVSNSTLQSAIQSGSMFYLTNTSANIVLSNSTLDFDSSKANLLLAEGNDSNNWGTAGSNGATVKLTGLNQTLNGNITVDTISSADIYLLSASTYTGMTSIETNAVNTNASASPFTMNISSDSKWIVTGDSTVTNLNVEDGGQIVDEDGKTVTIMVNGIAAVTGDSSYTVTVTGSYGTSFETSSDNALSTEYIDRTDFDSTYNVSTAFSTNGTKSSAVTATSQTETVTVTEAEDDNTLLIAGICAVCAIAVIAGILIVKNKKKTSK